MLFTPLLQRMGAASLASPLANLSQPGAFGGAQAGQIGPGGINPAPVLLAAPMNRPTMAMMPRMRLGAVRGPAPSGLSALDPQRFQQWLQYFRSLRPDANPSQPGLAAPSTTENADPDR
jgi:hypothetical protein